MFSKWLATFGWALSLAILAGCAEKPENLIAQGRLRLTRGDFAGAISFFDLALKRDPKSVEALVGRGDAFARSGRLKEAVRDLTTARELSPRNGSIVLQLAEARMLAGDETAASKDYSTLLDDKELDVDDRIRASAHLGRGRIRIAGGQIDEALADFNESIARAMAHVPADLAVAADSLVWKGKIELSRSDSKAAAKTLSLAIEYKPDNAYAWWLRAAANEQQGQTRSARLDRRRAIKLDPRFQIAQTPAAAEVLSDIRGQGLGPPRTAVGD
jgi:Flp pilus assembly protein TadD